MALFSHTVSLRQIEHIQKRALEIEFPEDSYSTSLEMANLPTLYQRREHQCQTLYKSIHQQSDNKLRKLLPIASSYNYKLRNPRTYPLFKCRTERFKNSFIPKCVTSVGQRSHLTPDVRRSNGRRDEIGFPDQPFEFD